MAAAQVCLYLHIVACSPCGEHPCEPERDANRCRVLTLDAETNTTQKSFLRGTRLHPNMSTERREKNKRKSDPATHQKKNMPLIDTWPQGGGGAEPTHTTPAGQGTSDGHYAYHGIGDQRPVTDRRLALHPTSGTSPTHTGAELCAPVPTWKGRRIRISESLQRTAGAWCPPIASMR